MLNKQSNQPEKPRYVYIVDFSRNSLVEAVEWVDRPWLQRLKSMGLVHHTHADAKEAAEQMLCRVNHSEQARQKVMSVKKKAPIILDHPPALASHQQHDRVNCESNWLISAPKWAKWAAMDENGRWRWFSLQPYNLFYTWTTEGYAAICQDIHPRPPKFKGHWRQSLIQVPFYTIQAKKGVNQ